MKNNDFRQFIIDTILESELISEVEENKNIYLKDLDMSVSLRNSLRKGNFNTLNELTLISKKKLLRKIDGFGNRRLEELDLIMKKHKLKFAEIDNK